MRRNIIVYVIIVFIFITSSCSKSNQATHQEGEGSSGNKVKQSVAEETYLDGISEFKIDVEISSNNIPSSVSEYEDIENTIKNYLREQTITALESIKFGREKTNRYHINVDAQFEFGSVVAEMSGLPGISVTTSGTFTFNIPKIQCNYIISTDKGETLMEYSFNGTNLWASNDLKGIKMNIDLCIGNLLAEFAKKGIATDEVISTLVGERRWLPDRHMYGDVNMGYQDVARTVRMHQDNSLWHALKDIGEPAAINLRKVEQLEETRAHEELERAVREGRVAR